MEIPYTVTARADTGVNNAKLGVWLFLASEVMLFGALFTSYILLRTTAPEWPKGYEILNVPLATLNTAVLITSSITMVMAWASLMMKNFSKYKIYMGLTIILGLAFLVIKALEYGPKFSHGLYPSTNTFFAIYFTLTGLHGLHVIGGMIILNLFIGVIMNSMQESQAEAEALVKKNEGIASVSGEDIAAVEHQLDELKRRLAVLRHRLGKSA